MGKTNCKLSINQASCSFSIGKSDLINIERYMSVLDNL